MLVGLLATFCYTYKSEQIPQGTTSGATTTQRGAEVIQLRGTARDSRVLSALCASMVAMLLLVCVVTGLVSITRTTGNKHEDYKDKWS